MPALRVVTPGLLTSVQDLGREGSSRLGVVRGGAADALSLRAANRLAGNPDGAAALEMTLTGGAFEFEGDAAVVLGAIEVHATVERPGGDARRIGPWRREAVRAGDVLKVGPITRGARAYLAVAGGVAAEPVLGSASTHLSAGFGGHEGRTLRAGDRLTAASASRAGAHAPPSLGDAARAWLIGELERRTLRAMDGPQAAMLGAGERERFWSARFAAARQSDRVGLRLEGPTIASPSAGRMTSEGMPPGGVQIPPDGRAIVLGVDHPTTGGYPLIACVASVDFPALGQLRPGDAVRFARVTLDEARALRRAQEDRLNAELPPA